jgi:hypothetical protein
MGGTSEAESPFSVYLLRVYARLPRRVNRAIDAWPSPVMNFPPPKLKKWFLLNLVLGTGSKIYLTIFSLIPITPVGE